MHWREGCSGRPQDWHVSDAQQALSGALDLQPPAPTASFSSLKYIAQTASRILQNLLLPLAIFASPIPAAWSFCSHLTCVRGAGGERADSPEPGCGSVCHAVREIIVLDIHGESHRHGGPTDTAVRAALGFPPTTQVTCIPVSPLQPHAGPVGVGREGKGSW